MAMGSRALVVSKVAVCTQRPDPKNATQKGIYMRFDDGPTSRGATSTAVVPGSATAALAALVAAANSVTVAAAATPAS